MPELTIGYTAFGSLIGLAIGSLMYMLGGRDNISKGVRRFGGSFVIAATVNAASIVMGKWNPWFLITYPCLVFGFSLGYGGDVLFTKVIRRTIFCLGVLTASLSFVFVLGGATWLLFPLHIGVAIWTIWLGVRNPIHAAAEEFFICVLLNLGLIMYPFIGGV